MSFSLSYKPLMRHAGNAPSNSASPVAPLLKRTASLLKRSCDPSPLLHHPSVYSCCLATRDLFTSALHSNSSGAKLTAQKTPLSSTVAQLPRLQRQCLSKSITLSSHNTKDKKVVKEGVLLSPAVCSKN
jgi:hypothetical protein